MAEVGSSTSSPGVSLHDWLDEDFEESLNDEEINVFVQNIYLLRGTAVVEIPTG